MRSKIIFILLFIISNVVQISHATELPTVFYPVMPSVSQHRVLNLNEKNDYVKAWVLFNKGEREEALKIAEKYNETQAEIEGWSILIGAIYYEQGNYKEALRALSVIRPKLDKAYAIIKEKTTLLQNDEFESLNFHYYKMLLISGLANYELENRLVALKDLLEYSEKFKEASVYEYIGLIYYKEKRYTDAISYFEQSYQLQNDGELKDNAAFSIGALYANMGNVKKAIDWLRIPLCHDKKWLKMIIEDKDKDFEAIQHDNNFKIFLQQGR